VLDLELDPTTLEILTCISSQLIQRNETMRACGTIVGLRLCID
jgi:hypothetical protein